MFDAVFLDLEETVIESWHSPYYTNIQKVRKWLNDNAVKEAGIFSFAIYNDPDKRRFEQEMKAGLSDVLGISLTTWPSVLDMIAVDTKHTGVRWITSAATASVDSIEYVNMRGKQQGFINYVNEVLPHARRIALLDDIVDDLTLTYRDTGREITLVNVTKLEGVRERKESRWM
jgi:hypothetical protein